jgi:hypothetical protein
LLSFAAASYSQPVYCTTAVCPADTAAPVPGVNTVDCKVVTGLGGATTVCRPPHALSAAKQTNRTNLVNLWDAMHGILMHFLRAVVSTGAREYGCADGARADAACHDQAHLRLQAQCVVAQCADGIVDFVDHL